MLIFSETLFNELSRLEKKEFEISKYSYDTMETLIKYIYTGKASLNEKNVNQILLASDYYKLSSLKDSCFDYMVKSLDKDSCFETLRKAKNKEFNFDATSLMEKCIQFMQKRAEEIVETNSFLDLDEETIIAFCKDDKLCIDELHLFKSIQKWGEHQIKKHKKSISLKEQLKNILPHIRYPLMSVEELSEIVKPTGLIPHELYIQTMEYFATPKAFEDSNDPQFRDRSKPFSGSKLLTSSYCSLLRKWLDNKKRVWKLAYRASKDGWAASDFHRCMDNKGESIVVIQSENGNIFGGYSALPWQSIGSYRYDNRCFLFSLKNATGKPVKIQNNGPHVAGQYSIYCGSNYGPTFGGGHDLCKYN